MTTRQDWKEYFEVINGRMPTLQEFQEAKAKGEFDDGDASSSAPVQAAPAQEAIHEVPQSVPQAQASAPEQSGGFINYYTELDFPQSFTVEQIKAHLDEKLNEARTRVQKMKDRYTRIINLIGKAQEIFATEESKTAYDAELAEAGKIPEPVVQVDERVVKFNEWLDKARNYYEDSKYDLAAKALDKVRDYRTDEKEIDSLILSGWVYNDAHEYKLALDRTNEALVLQEDFPFLYRLKFIAMYNINKVDDERKDKTTIFSKGNDLASLLNNYIEKAKSWEFTTDEVVDEAEDFASGWYFYELSSFYNPSDKNYYSDHLITDERAKTGKSIADSHSSMRDSANVIKAYGFAVNQRDAFKEWQDAKKAADAMTVFKIQNWMLYVVGGLIVVGLATMAMGTGWLFLLLGVGGGIGLFVYKSQQETAKKAAQARANDFKKKRDEAWSKVSATYNEWKTGYFA